MFLARNSMGQNDRHVTAEQASTALIEKSYELGQARKINVKIVLLRSKNRQKLNKHIKINKEVKNLQK